MQVFGSDYPTADGTALRDYVHVVDLAEAHVAALRHLSAGGASAALNLGTGQGVSVREVIARVGAVTGAPVPFVEAPRRAGDPAALVADPRLAEATLKWRARRDLDAMIADAWRWHRRLGSGTRPERPRRGAAEAAQCAAARRLSGAGTSAKERRRQAGPL